MQEAFIFSLLNLKRTEHKITFFLEAPIFKKKPKYTVILGEIIPLPFT